MESKIRIYNRTAAILIFIGLPVLFWALGDVPKRTTLKETLSLITLIAFSMMLAQFYLARSNRAILKGHKMGKIVKWHKVLGYIFVSILLVHPLLVVVPRYFESGISPEDAFITLITTFDSPGVILGIIAWFLMLIIGITSLIRNQLPMSYKTWRVVHGVLSIAFITVGTWHAVELGRHSTTSMSVFMIFMAGVGVLLLLKTYFLPSPKKS